MEVDGTYGSNTTFAVKKFQEYNNIPISGIVDQITWNKIFSSNCLNYKGCIGPFSVLQPGATVDMQYARVVAEEIVADFEGGKYALAGNFDGAGLSVGYIQTNLKYGLGELLSSFANSTSTSALFDDLFDFDIIYEGVNRKGYDVLRDVLTKSIQEQILWGDSISDPDNKYELNEPWDTAFNNMVRNDSFLSAYENSVRVNEYRTQALSVYNYLGLNTVRGYILAFDIAVNNWDTQRSLVNDAMNEESNMLTNLEDPYYDNIEIPQIKRDTDRMVVQDMMDCINAETDPVIKMCYYTAAAAALKKGIADGICYSWDSWLRKKAIIKGEGDIHGRPINSEILTDNIIIL